MGPINAQERRSQFFRFLLLFLLTVAPITTVVYLYGRVDHVENAFLRSKYTVANATREQGAVLEKQLTDVLNQLNDVNELATKPEMQELDNKWSANMKTKLKALEDRIKVLEKNAVDPKDEVLLALVKTANIYHLTIDSYNELYRKASERLISVDEKAAECELKKREWKEVAKDAIARLPKEDRELLVVPE